MKGANGPETGRRRIAGGLDVVADALNRRDIGRAMIAALHLRLPDLAERAAFRIASADDLMKRLRWRRPISLARCISIEPGQRSQTTKSKAASSTMWLQSPGRE
jgi:hypothetical protein